MHEPRNAASASSPPMTTKNTGTAPFEFTAGFHPYLRVRERDGVTVKGLAGESYIYAEDMSEHVLAGDLEMKTATDHVFSLSPAAKHEAAVIDGGLRRAIAMASSGNTKTVVWNPGPEGKLPDFEPDDWRKFVCVEPVSDWPGGRTLAPGEEHVLAVAIQSTLEK